VSLIAREFATHPARMPVDTRQRHEHPTPPWYLRERYGMSSIGGPGGIGGPKGPSGPGGPGELDGAGEAGELGEVAAEAGVERASGTAGTSSIATLSAEVAAGRLTAREAIDRLVDEAAGPELGAAERAELREILTDLVENDPYLGSLARQV